MSRFLRALWPLIAGACILNACDRDSAGAGEAAAQNADAAHDGSTSGESQGSSRQAVGGSLPDFTGLVRQYGAAVVNVNVVGRAEQTAGMPPGDSEDPFGFFRHFGIPSPGDVPQSGEDSGPVPRGQGSGFIVSADGYVLTNAHVVDQAVTVTVKLPDRREFAAKVVGADRRSDVAVLKVDAKALPTVQSGDPSMVQPGQWVAAIGSPFGFENSVTVGVVSATARALGPQSSLVPFIQTDVAVNPGNSGGPLFNLRGEVIGINSQIYSATGGYQGLSFAIPIDVALDVKRQLIETGRVTRGKIGVVIQDVDAKMARAFGLDRPRGALVNRVEPDSPPQRPI